MTDNSNEPQLPARLMALVISPSMIWDAVVVAVFGRHRWESGLDWWIDRGYRKEEAE